MILLFYFFGFNIAIAVLQIYVLMRLIVNLTKVSYIVRTMPKRKASTKTSSTKQNASKKKKTEAVEKATNDSSPKLDAGDRNTGVVNGSSEVVLKTKDGRDCNLKIVSWNVAGLRAWAKKDGHKWLADESPDIICLQETKCEEKDVPQVLKDMSDYEMHWNAATVKKGFGGTALFSKVKPKEVKYGIGVSDHDQEGRTITAEYDQFYLVNTYVPNSQRGLKRLDYRMKWNEDFKNYLLGLDSLKPVILCGDMNVSHLEIDLANPKSNRKNAGFTQEERDGMSELLQSGFVDTFRHLYPDDIKKYTFWTYMGNARAKNVGWRLDYFIISQRWLPNLCDNVMKTNIMGSDHCPIQLCFSLPDLQEEE